MGADTRIVTDDSFAAEVLQSDQLVLVHFWAQWCGPSRVLAPVLDEIAEANHGTVVVASLNIDENPASASEYAVASIPTMALFQGGKLVTSIVGAKSKDDIQKELEACSTGRSHPSSPPTR